MYENELKNDERKIGKKFREESKKFSFWYNNLEKGLKHWQKKDSAKSNMYMGLNTKINKVITLFIQSVWLQIYIWIDR